MFVRAVLHRYELEFQFHSHSGIPRWAQSHTWYGKIDPEVDCRGTKGGGKPAGPPYCWHYIVLNQPMSTCGNNRGLRMSQHDDFELNLIKNTSTNWRYTLQWYSVYNYPSSMYRVTLSISDNHLYVSPYLIKQNQHGICVLPGFWLTSICSLVLWRAGSAQPETLYNASAALTLHIE